MEALAHADPEVPVDLNDRAQDNWRSLFAIADLAGGDWSQHARDAALSLHGEGQESEFSDPLQLLIDIREMFSSEEANRVSSADLLNYLHGLEERPWSCFSYGRPITQRQLAKMLRPFGVQSASIRVRGRATTVKGYHRDWFNDPFARYLPAELPERPERSSAA